VSRPSTRHYPPPEFCKVLAEARAAAGWSTRRLGARAGLDHSFVAKMERGERAPSVTVARRLIAALGLTGAAAATVLAGAVPDSERWPWSKG
jgi:ribosome-binding protein aMBF1 (putative translation factor)